MPANNPAGSFDLEFPSTMKAFEELLILGHSDSINMRRELGAAGNLCLFVVKPKMNAYEIFPQDWFNNGKLDYGYQWVTRVARDPISGKIFGEGFRVSSFVLDDSLRQIEESFPYDALFGRQDK